MHQKDRVKQAWIDAGLFKTNDARLLEFLKRLDTAPYDCWPEFVEQCRRNYPEYKSRLVKPIWQTGDKLLRLMLLRTADFSRPDEVKLTRGFIAQCDPATDALELEAVLLKATPTMANDIRKLPNLTPRLRSAANAVKKAAVPAAVAAAIPPARRKAKR